MSSQKLPTPLLIRLSSSFVVHRSLNVPALMQRQKELEATVNSLKEQIDRLKRDVSVLLDAECHPVFCTIFI